MSLNISGFFGSAPFDFEITDTILKHEYKIEKIDNLSPEKLSVTFLNKRIIVLHENIFIEDNKSE